MSMLDHAINAQEEFLRTLEELVSFETPTANKEACDRLATRLEEIFAADGWSVARHERSLVGDIVEARLPGGTGPSTLVLTHYDTVWGVGTLGDMPWRRDGDRVYGPGTCDMKAGIVAALLAPRLLTSAGTQPGGPVTVLMTSDEEAGSNESRGLIEELARDHDRVLVLETGRDDGALKIGRKGVSKYVVTFRGRSAHAGNHPELGASALRELAHFLIYAEDLADPEAGTTIHVTVASGGTVINVIPELASAQIDVRTLRAGEPERVDGALRSYRPRDDRVAVEVDGGVNRPPMELTEQNRRLWEEARACMEELGLGLEGATVGGGSDGNFTSAQGVATLDGLGSAGGGAHARDEHIRLRETLERMALLALLLTGRHHRS